MFALIFLVLLSSSNFMVGIHLCSGEIQNIGFLTKAQVCEKEQSLPACHRPVTTPCCEDETIVHRSEESKPSVSHINVAAPVTMDLVGFQVLISEVIPTSPLSRTPYSLYDPPGRSLDITISNQVFII
jgi:hypothetical protein